VTPAFSDFVPARLRSHINQHSKDQTMNRYIFTRRGRLMLAIVNTAGALFFVACLLTLALAYFDVLTK
jgi:hypothetical protein